VTAAPEPDVGVRAATAADAEAVAEVQVTTWRQAYGQILPAPTLAALRVGDVARTWRQALTAPPGPRDRLLVATARGRVVGAAALGAAGDPDAAGAGELSLLLVVPTARGVGHASRLLAAAVTGWLEQGSAEAVAWVFEADRVLGDFLVGAGWGPDGRTRSLAVGGAEQAQVRMHTRLVPEQRP